MSAALDALRVAILTNTLDLGQQTALANALAIISPAFPEPDEISNSIPQGEEVLARDWMAALYAVQAGGGTGGLIPVQSGTLILPNGAALSGTSAPGLPTGQPAIVETFGAEFSLQPIGALVVDGSTVLASTDPTRVWERGDSVITETALAQTHWSVDPVAGNNEATGLDDAHAIKDTAEIARRMGTLTPHITIPLVTVKLLNNQLDDSDPWLFRPIGSGGMMLLTADLPATAMTATLSGTTPKNRGAVGGQPLQTQFTVATGGPGVGMLLVNTDRGNSRAMIGQDLGGGVFALQQPHAPIAPNTFPVYTEVDTWTSGDHILGYFPVAANVPVMGGTIDTFSNAGAMQFYQVTIFDPFTQLDPVVIDLESGVIVLDCPFGRSASLAGQQTPEQPFFINCAFPFGFAGSAPSQFSYEIDGCSFTAATSFDGGALIQHDTFFGGTTVRHFARNSRLGFVAILGGNRLEITGPTDLGSVSDSGVVYATGTLDPNPGTLTYLGAAATQLTCTLNVRGNANAYAVHTAAGTTTVFPLAVTAANLDAPSGVGTGAGGLLFNPAGGSFYHQGVTP